ncbi:MAG: hypothetical protein WBB15_07370 [Ornithinimicrobium sp.]
MSWWRAIAGYPATWVAALILVVTTFGLVVLLEPTALFTAILLGLAGALLVAWPVTMAMTGTLTQRQFAPPQVEDVNPAELSALAAELARLPDPQPAEQLAALPGKRQSLIAVLERRLDSGELTYSRYLASAQQVYATALENLHEVALASESISTIDEDYVRRRLAELNTDRVDQESAGRERETLERRLHMRDTQRRRIARLLAQNESALTALDRTSTALAEVPMGKRPEDADVAMAALEELADRASKYAD